MVRLTQKIMVSIDFTILSFQFQKYLKGTHITFNFTIVRLTHF